MPLTFNTSPYWDDYDPLKDFYKVLTRPGVAIQVRELSTLQSILEEQIARFGNHIFTEGSMVIPGQTSYDQNLTYVKVNATFSGPVVDYDSIDPAVTGTIIQIKGVTTGVVAQVIQVARSINTLYIKYVSSGTNNTTGIFADNEILEVLPSNTQICQAIVTGSTGITASASIQDGVYFVFGKFLSVYSQTIRLADYNNFPSVRVGLQVVETIVTPEDDPSLNDNTSGTSNYAAPGAHRYKIELILTAIDIDAISDNNFVELMRIVDGTIQSQVVTTIYSDIESTLARRTFDANGDFISTPFAFDLHESLLNGNNGGIFTALQGGDETKLALGIEPGKAYVQGHEIATISKQFINLDKARSTNFFQNSHTRAYLGNYVFINRLFGMPNYDKWPTVQLYSTPIITDGVVPGGSPIGTATIRGLEFYQGSFQSIGNPGPIFKCFLTDINITVGGTSVTDIRSLAVTDGTLLTTANVLTQVDIVNVVGSFSIGSTITGASYTEKVYAWDTTNNLLLTLPTNTSIPVNTPIVSSSTGTANILQRISLFDTADNILLYTLPQAVVSTVRDQSNNITTTYSYRKVFTPASTTAGTVTFATGVNEVFASLSISDYVASIETGTNSGTLIDVTNSNPIFASGLTQLIFNAPAGTTIKLSATVVKEISAEKTKTLNTQNLTVSGPGTIVNLGRADVYNITGIWIGTNNTGQDVTSWYTLDNGQRDNRYDLGTLTLQPGYTSPSSIFITYTYFSHSGGDYFSVNSYNNFGSFTDWYSRIPYYNSFALRDCLDFRPRVDDISVFPPVGPVPTVPTYISGIGKLVKPNDDVITDFSYYLARIDKIYLSPTGYFTVIKGTPALTPLEPPDPSVGMVVAIISYPAYTLSPKVVTIKTIPNEVFTMVKIGKLRDRIVNLEYYTALNLLEQQTASFNIPDTTTGLDRFKAGFVVDRFVDMSISDYNNADTEFSIDAPNSIMRPTYGSNVVNMGFDATQSSNVEYNTLKSSNNILTLPYTESPIVVQDKASRMENINPYNIFQFIGIVTLDPATDTWKSTVYLPDITVTDNSVYNATIAKLGSLNTLGTVWNEWTTTWVGSPVITGTYSNNDGGAQAIAESAWRPGQPYPTGSYTETNTAITTVTTQQTRTGTQTTLINVPNKTVNNSVVNTGLIPYCRKNTINFIAKGLRPLTLFYVYFDNVNVTALCTGTLVTDANGALSGTFNLPDPDVTNPTNSFRTGTRIFKLTNEPNNIAANTTSFATANYVASGIVETDQRTITSVGNAQIQQQSVTDSRSINNVTTSSTDDTVNWVDPLAQSLLVGTLQGGFCATSVDIFFATKDANIPVMLQIREMQNGSPTQSVVPFSTVVLNPSSINISSDASIKTNFLFPSPVYLKQNVEYAIVLISNSNAYFVWTALMGDLELNTDRLISQVPYTGLLFKSQNASTWVPSPAEALKFTLYRAVFNTAVLGIGIVENPVLPLRSLPNLSLVTYNGYNTIRILHPNHGMPAGSKVTITIPPGAGNVNWSTNFNGIPVSDIIPTVNGDLRTSSWASGIADTVLGSRTYTVNNVELDSYTIDIVDGTNVAVNATSSGLTGVTLTVTENYAYDVMMPIINELNFPGTSTNYYFRAITEKSTHGAQIPYQRDLGGVFPFTQFIPNKNFELTSPRVVASLVNETNLINMGSAFANKSLVWEINLTSTLNNLSPMVDMSRCSAILINNRIDYKIDVNTPVTVPTAAAPPYIAPTVAIGGTDSAQYITRPVSLAVAANSIHFLLSVMWPYGAQVDVYYKILPTNTNATFGSQPYVLMSPDPNTNFSPAQNPTDFKDYYWTADNIGEFTTFAIKVVMRSTNSSAVPLCMSLRAIALET
jgi:hypothetical protein